MTDDGEQEGKRPAEVYRAPSGEAVLCPQEDDEISLVGFVNILLRHRWKVLATPVALAVLVVVVTVLLPPAYTSDASFVPQTGGGSGQLSQLSGVASQFGIDVPIGQVGQSPQFYANLLASRRLLEEAVTTSYVVAREVAVTTYSTARSDATEVRRPTIVDLGRAAAEGTS